VQVQAQAQAPLQSHISLDLTEPSEMDVASIATIANLEIHSVLQYVHLVETVTPLKNATTNTTTTNNTVTALVPRRVTRSRPSHNYRPRVFKILVTA